MPDENKAGGLTPDQPDVPESNGSTNGSSAGVSGTSMGGRQSAEVIRGDNEVDAASSAAQSTGEASGSALSGAMGTVGSVAFGMARLVANGGRSLGRSIMNMGSRVGGKLMVAGAGMSAFTGGAITPVAGAVITGGTAATSLVTVGAVGMSIVGTPLSMREGALQSCVDNPLTGVQAALGDGGGGMSAGDIGGQMEDNAKKIWSAFKKAGMSDENIAGILGNFQRESLMDPTSVESIFDEPFEMGPRKKEVDERGFTNHGEGNNATNLVGVGLAGWTNDQNKLLREYADSKNRDWYELDLQLAYMLDGNSGDLGRQYVEEMLENTNDGHDDPEEASDYFHDMYERSADAGRSKSISRDYSRAWYVKMKGWSVDNSFANSVLSLAETKARQANSQDVQNQLAACPGLAEGNFGGNADAAEAMATYSYAFLDQGIGNDGTELYQYLHKEIFPGDPYFQSCDRGVATAVRWSGTDDTFPPGPTSAQYQYFTGEGKEKWSEVKGDIRKESTLKAGDVLVTRGDGHIQMYLSKEVIEDVWGNKPREENASMASASIGGPQRSPGLQNFEGYSTDGRPYSGWRSKGGEENSKYKDIKIPAGIKSGPQTGGKASMAN